MVRAIIEGRKTQTRRIVMPQPEDAETALLRGIGFSGKGSQACPYDVGMRLWVRETWHAGEDVDGPYVLYPATGTREYWELNNEGDWLIEKCNQDSEVHDGWRQTLGKPSIHMPRWASRITLEITGVRVERVQEITEEDAISEGWQQKWPDDPRCDNFLPVPWFRELWNNINDRRGYGWAMNPWVWVIEFRKV